VPSLNLTANFRKYVERCPSTPGIFERGSNRSRLSCVRIHPFKRMWPLDRGTSFVTGSASTMPLLRWPHGRDRGLPWCRSTPRATGNAHLFRDEGVVTRHDLTRSLAGAMPLPPLARRTPEAATSSVSKRIVSVSMRLPSRLGVTNVPVLYPRPSICVVTSTSSPSCLMRLLPGLLKTP
jgi:hypothetical protein